MSHQHWIITNRLVRRRRVDGHMVERVDPDVHDPLPTFRIGTFDPLNATAGLSSKVLTQRLDNAVTFVEDADIVNYDRIDADDDPANYKATRQMYLSLYQTMRRAPAIKGDVLFFIHGFNYSWADSLIHLQRLHDIYVAPPSSPINQIVYFSWPSYGSYTRYRSDQEIAYPSGALLGRLWGKTVRFYQSFFDTENAGGDRPAYCGRKIHLGAHSMGNQVLERFIASINDFDFLRLNLFGETLLLHADADWTALEPGKPLYALPNYCNRIHLYNHESDDALRVSEWTKNSEKRLGKHGPRDLDRIPPRTLIVDCSDSTGQVDEPGDPFFASAKNIILGDRDDASIRERMFDHWGYLNKPVEAADIVGVLRGQSASSTQLANTRKHKHGPLYTLT